jgi:hypothetical protein
MNMVVARIPNIRITSNIRVHTLAITLVACDCTPSRRYRKSAFGLRASDSMRSVKGHRLTRTYPASTVGLGVHPQSGDVNVSCVLRAATAPQTVCAAFPSRSGRLYFRRSFAYLTGTARFEPPKSLSTAKFMPITFPSRLKSGPPEPPEVVAAS